MTNEPKLYPNHRHQWTDADPALFVSDQARCTVCGFTVPRRLAKLDGTPTQPDQPEATP